jgi:hypothetical protein
MRVFVRLLICVVISLGATAAFAQSDSTDVFAVDGISDGCGDTMNGEECFWSDMSGGDYGYCEAWAKSGQQCQAAVRDIDTRVAYCDSVSRTAKCYCDKDTFRTSGTCTYRR